MRSLWRWFVNILPFRNAKRISPEKMRRSWVDMERKAKEHADARRKHDAKL